MKKNISLSHADNLTSGVFKIKENTFPNEQSSWKLQLFLTEKNENLKYDCEIELRITKPDLTNIPLRLHSDAPFIGNLNPSEDHSFSCDVDYNMEYKLLSQIMPESGIQYAVDFFE